MYSENQATKQSINLLFTHFKNCMHEGYFTSNHRRQGYGITIFDDSSIVIGRYKNDLLTGRSLMWITLDTYFIGQFNKGALDGPFVIRSPFLTVYSNITLNKIDGELLVIDYRSFSAQLWSIEGSSGEIGKEIQISPYQKDRVGGQKQILKSIAPYLDPLPSAMNYLKQNGQVFQTSIMKNMMKVKLLSSKDHDFLCFWLNQQEQILSYGLVSSVGAEGDLLKGIGYIYDPKTNLIEEGQFFNNKLHGEGAKEELGTEKMIYGNFNGGEIRKVDILTDERQEIKKLLSKRKRVIHIHSLQFVNNYGNQRPILILKNLMRIIVEEK